LCGIASETFLRLWTRAPRIRIDSSKGLLRESGDLPAVYLDYLKNPEYAKGAQTSRLLNRNAERCTIEAKDADTDCQIRDAAI
jgi:hypothetical protein